MEITKEAPAKVDENATQTEEVEKVEKPKGIVCINTIEPLSFVKDIKEKEWIQPSCPFLFILIV